MRARGSLATALLLWGALAAAPAGAGAADARVRVMTWNLYVGAPFGLDSLPPDLPALAAAADGALATAEASDIPGRMDAVARAVAAARPDVIGLQEAALWRVQEPGDGLLTPALQVRADALASLRAALGARGLRYRVAALSTNADAEIAGASGRDVRLTDRDAILVRAGASGWRVARRGAGRFARSLIVPSPLGPLPVPRGWAQADLRRGDLRLRVVSTHLDPSSASVRLAQAREIVRGPAAVDGPVAVVGDMNARPRSAAYRALKRGGALRDAWTHVNGGRPGRTCCHDVSLVLDDPVERRIDLIMLGNGARASAARPVGGAAADRTPSGLWPSDHIGVLATIRVPADRPGPAGP